MMYTPQVLFVYLYTANDEYLFIWNSEKEEIYLYMPFCQSYNIGNSEQEEATLNGIDLKMVTLKSLFWLSS